MGKLKLSTEIVRYSFTILCSCEEERDERWTEITDVIDGYLSECTDLPYISMSRRGTDISVHAMDMRTLNELVELM